MTRFGELKEDEQKLVAAAALTQIVDEITAATKGFEFADTDISLALLRRQEDIAGNPDRLAAVLTPGKSTTNVSSTGPVVTDPQRTIGG